MAQQVCKDMSALGVKNLLHITCDKVDEIL